MGLDPGLRVELGFSEGLLDSWAAREAFLLFGLLIEPDPPTWRAWLGYQNSATGRDFSAPKRSAAAYLRLLKDSNDAITDTVVEALAAEPRAKSRGAGGIAIWDRAARFLALRENLAYLPRLRSVAFSRPANRTATVQPESRFPSKLSTVT